MENTSGKGTVAHIPLQLNGSGHSSDSTLLLRGSSGAHPLQSGRAAHAHPPPQQPQQQQQQQQQQLPQRKPEEFFPVQIGYQVIFIVMLLFIVLGQAGGVVLYYRSQNSLDDQAEKLSLVETAKTTDRILGFIETTHDIAHGMERYIRYGMGLHHKFNNTAEQDLLHAIGYAIPYLTNFEGPFIQGVEIALLPTEFPDAGTFAFQKVWWTQSKGRDTQDMHIASYLPSLRQNQREAPDGRPECYYNASEKVIQAIGMDFKPDKGLDITRDAATFAMNIYDDVALLYERQAQVMATGRQSNLTKSTSLAQEEYLEPAVGFARDGTPYMYLKYSALFQGVPDPHSWSQYWGFSISLQFKTSIWQQVADEVVESDEGGTVVVFDLAKDLIYAVAGTIGGDVDLLGDCKVPDPSVTPLGQTETSVCAIDPITHSPEVRDAYHEEASRSARDPEGRESMFSVMLLGSGAYYAQYEHIWKQGDAEKEQLHHAGGGSASREHQVPALDVITAVLHSTQDSSTELQSAQIVLLVFFVAVIIIYFALCLVQYFLVNLPLEQLVTASNLMASLQIGKAGETVAQDPSCLRSIQLHEVQVLRENFQRTLQFMAEYVKYVPNGVIRNFELASGDSSEVVFSDMPHSEEQATRMDDTEDGGKATDGEEGKARRDEPYEPLFANMRGGFSMKNRVGSVLQVELKCLSWLQVESSGHRHMDTRRLTSPRSCVKESKAGEDLFTSETVNRLAMQFVEMALGVCKKTTGVMLLITPDICVITWNIHNSCQRHALSACLAACEVKKRVNQLDLHSPVVAQLPVVCAIASGSVLAGSVGDATTRAIAAVGETVTLVSQLTTLCCHLGIPIGISEDTFNRVEGLKRFDVRAVDRVQPDAIDPVPRRGCGKTLFIYEFRGELKSASSDPEHAVNRTRYNEGWQSFCVCDFETATHVLESITRKDRQVRRLLQLARHWMDYPDAELAANKFYVRCARFPYDHYEAQIPEFEYEPEPRERSRHDTEATDDVAEEAAALVKFTQNASQNGALAWLNGGDARSGDGDWPNFGGGHGDEEMGEGVDGSQYPGSAVGTLLSAGNPLPPRIRRRNQVWYTSHKVLGEGSFGTVFAGMTPEGELVAMKVLQLETDITEDEQMALIRESVQEIQMLSRLRHENIVGYHGTVFEAPHIIIVMEYMPGGSLAHLLLVFKRITESAVKRYAKDMLSGLRFLEEEGIVHGDFKPGNVLVMSDGTCKLADFGSCLSELNFDPDGAIVGTTLYMAPEVCRGEGRVFGSDVWAFGITIAELLEGSVPYDLDHEDMDLATYFAGVGAGDILPTIPQWLPKPAQDFLAGTLRQSAADRPSAAQLSGHIYLVT